MTTTAQPTGRLLLRNVRLAFPKLFVAEAFGDGKPSFGASLILGADHPQLAEIRAKMKAVAKEKWGAKADASYTSLEKTDKLALHDGDTKGQYDGFPGNWFVSANAQESARPTVIDGDKSPLTAASGKVYAGCYVNASVDLWVQDNGFGRRINAQLRGVQFLRDGDALAAGRPADSNEFEAVTEGAGADDFA